MKLADTVFKYGSNKKDIWMYHTTSSYKVRINKETLLHISKLLQQTDTQNLSKEEKFLLDKLMERKMIVLSDEKTQLSSIKDKTRLDSIELEFSSGCNLSCRHCFVYFSNMTSLRQQNATSRHMNREIIKKILKGARELDIITLVLSGGEPLLNPLFADTLTKARELDLKIIVLTNGTNLTDEIVKTMAENKVAETLVSLDSFRKYHDEIRGEGSFDRAVTGIKTLKKYGLNVYVTTIIHDRSAHTLEDFKNFCLNELGVSQVRLSAAVPTGRASDPAALKDFYISDANLRKIFSEECLDETSQKGKSNKSELKSFPCTAGSGQLFISADGIVYPCHYFQNLNEPLGNLNTQELAKIYENGLKHGPTAMFQPTQMKTCLSCARFAACRGGCRARAKLLTGDIYGIDPFKCRIYEKIPNHKLQISNHK